MSPDRGIRNGSSDRSIFDPVTQPINHWVSNFVTHHTSTEWLIGLAIILVWAVVAFASVGVTAALAAVLFAMALHYVAMETGSHIWLWFATATVLLFVIVAFGTVLEPLGPMVLTIGGACALAYNEAVRLNYTRRRAAIVDPGVFIGSTVALAVATAIGLFGIGISLILVGRSERNWLWMPTAVFILMVVSYAVAVLPTLRAPQSSGQSWEPGTRIPPQPLMSEAPTRVDGQTPLPPRR